MQKFENRLSSAQVKTLQEINAYHLFSSDLVLPIRSALTANAITPAVIQQKVVDALKHRAAYIEMLAQAQASLSALGVKADALESGQAEIGFLLPRPLFNNDLTGLHRELRTLDRILRTIYEVANVTAGEIEVRQISTSDPTFFFGMDVTVLVHLGHTIKWCVEVIKGSLDIKKIAEASRAASVSPEIVTAIEGQIAAKIDEAVKQKALEMLFQYKGDMGRRNELQTSLNSALEQMLQRVERGMTVEIRLIPPPAQQTLAGDAHQAETREKFDELAAISKSLEFPQVQGAPALQLTTDEPHPGAG